MTNFRLFQTERVCRRQFQFWQKWQKVIQTGRKHCGKRRNCSLWAISPFPTVFSKGLFPWGVKRVKYLSKLTQPIPLLKYITSLYSSLYNPFPNIPFWDRPKFKEAADDNWNVAINPLPHNSTFWRARDIWLWKTLWEKEKLLVTSNFFFFHNVFHPM